jgi:hypothetical protein
MKTLKPAIRGAATTAMIGAGLWLLATTPSALAENGSRPLECRYARASSCAQSNTVGTPRPYEQWQDGSPAVGSTAPPPQRYSPTYSNGHNALYGFGR